MSTNKQTVFLAVISLYFVLGIRLGAVYMLCLLPILFLAFAYRGGVRASAIFDRSFRIETYLSTSIERNHSHRPEQI